MNIKQTLLVAACAFLLALAACQAAPPMDEQAREINKWNAYVDLNNDLTLHFFQPLDRYFAAFGRAPQYRPAADHHDVVAFVSSLASAEELKRRIEGAQAAAADPADDLDRAAGAMAAHLAELWQGLVETRHYHGAQVYREDDYAGAEALHNRIQAAHEDFEPAFRAFTDLLHQRDAQRRKDDLADMTGRRLVIKPAMLRAVDAAQNIQDYLGRQGITEATINDVDPDLLNDLHQKLTEAAHEFLALRPAEEAITGESLKAEGLDVFRPRLTEVLISAEAAMAYCRPPVNNSYAPPKEPGPLQKLSQDIGILVDTYNSTIN